MKYIRFSGRDHSIGPMNEIVRITVHRGGEVTVEIDESTPFSVLELMLNSAQEAAAHTLSVKRAESNDKNQNLVC